MCSRKECFISGSFDRTVMLWDQRAEKCQVKTKQALIHASFTFRLINDVLSALRAFYVHKGDQLLLMMSKGLFLQLLLVDT